MVEVDGDTHENLSYDAARDRAFSNIGIRVLRFTNAQVVHEIDAVIQVILDCLTHD